MQRPDSALLGSRVKTRPRGFSRIGIARACERLLDPTWTVGAQSPICLACRHPGPPYETKGARASGTLGGGSTAGRFPTGADQRCALFPPRALFGADLGDRANPRAQWFPHRHCPVRGAIYRLSAESLSLVTQAKGLNQRPGKSGLLLGSTLLPPARDG